MTDDRKSAPAALRNRDAILGVLRDVLPPRGLVLEIASGTGEHAVHFARHFPGLAFQPTDPDEGARRSIAGWIAESGLSNLRQPIAFDAAAATWPIAAVDAIICINMIHISPWPATLGLLKGAAASLPAGGPLYLYGPYRRRGVPTVPSNEAFDESLRSRDPSWGLRLLEDVVARADECGLVLDRIVEMPANNLSVVLRKG
jgi:hypothetical protein